MLHGSVFLPILREPFLRSESNSSQACSFALLGQLPVTSEDSHEGETMNHGEKKVQLVAVGSRSTLTLWDHGERCQHLYKVSIILLKVIFSTLFITIHKKVGTNEQKIV